MKKLDKAKKILSNVRDLNIDKEGQDIIAEALANLIRKYEGLLKRIE